MLALFTTRRKIALFSAAIAATAFAPLQASSQCVPNIPDIVARALDADGVLAPRHRIPGNPDYIVIQPYSVVATGDGQMGPDVRTCTTRSRPEVAADGLARAPGNVSDFDDPIAKSLQ